MMKLLLKMGGIALVSVNLVLLSGCGGGGGAAAASAPSTGTTSTQGIPLPSKVSVVQTQ